MLTPERAAVTGSAKMPGLLLSEIRAVWRHALTRPCSCCPVTICIVTTVAGAEPRDCCLLTLAEPNSCVSSCGSNYATKDIVDLSRDHGCSSLYRGGVHNSLSNGIYTKYSPALPPPNAYGTHRPESASSWLCWGHIHEWIQIWDWLFPAHLFIYLSFPILTVSYLLGVLLLFPVA